MTSAIEKYGASIAECVPWPDGVNAFTERPVETHRISAIGKAALELK